MQTLKAVYIRVHNPFNLNPTHFFLASATMALYCSSKFAIQVRELANIPNKGEIGRGGRGVRAPLSRCVPFQKAHTLYYVL